MPVDRATRRAVRRLAAAFTAVSVLAVLTGCLPVVTAGERLTEERDIPDATSVVLRSSGDVTVRLGDEPSLSVTGGENVLARLRTEVENGRLVIDVQRGPILVGAGDLDIDITLTSLKAVAITGSGDVTADFDGAEEVTLEIGGSGGISAEGVDASSVRASISGSGEIEADGSTDRLDVQVSGSGSVDTSRLRAIEAVVVLSGSGSIDVDVAESLDVTLSGSGSVSYSGRPQVRSTVSGSGEIGPA
ncbi:head GIN domain-containing protein [Agromyces sp. SYSU T0242]|uniref:head GIN domain-containing protein n=1 Tax=Agromyces litoreus TaxID=3158561 RepID=UPI003399B5E1